MPLTVKKVTGFEFPMPFGVGWTTWRKIDFDASYPVGGESLTTSELGFGNAPVLVEIAPRSGFMFEYDLTNKKVKVLAPVKKYTATYDAASLAATTARDDTITVTGVAATDQVIGVQLPAAFAASLEAQLVRVSALDTIILRLNNPSAAAVDAASGTVTFYVVKANGAAQEVPDTTDLSALTGVEVKAYGQIAA